MSICVYCKSPIHEYHLVHIIAESLGNNEHVLQTKLVCKRCNHYFGAKVEKKFIESDFCSHYRFLAQIPSKSSKRIPPIKAIIEYRDRLEAVILSGRNIESAIASATNAQEYLRIHIPPPPRPERGSTTSRFLAKVATEAVLARCESPEEQIPIEWINDLDWIAEYARYGKPRDWGFFIKKTYNYNAKFSEGEIIFDIPHEWSFFSDNKGALFFFLRLFGYEFAIDLGSPNSFRLAKYLENFKASTPLELDQVVHTGTLLIDEELDWTNWD